MTVKAVDSIMGPFDYITYGGRADTTVTFSYRYNNPIGASDDVYIDFNVDSFVVDSYCGCE